MNHFKNALCVIESGNDYKALLDRAITIAIKPPGFVTPVTLEN